MSQIEKLIAIAEAECGYLEKKSNSQLDSKTANAGSANYTKYGAWYDNGSLQAQPWCAIFVSWSAEQAGIGSDIFYRHAYCPYGVTWYKNKGLWHARSGYTPKRGDIIYFQSGGVASHVGLVYAVDASKVYTIEGNTSGGSTLIANGGGVVKKSYALGYASILGYATPSYIATAEAETTIIKEDEEVTYEQWKEYMEQYRDSLRDNDSGNYSAEARKWCIDNGIFLGSGTTESGEPNYLWEDMISREQSATILYRFAQAKGLA